MSVRKNAIGSAVRLLEATGARFHIVDSEGNAWGEPIDTRTRAVRKDRGVKRDPSNTFVARYDYTNRLKAMQVGDVEEFVIVGDDKIERVRATITARATMMKPMKFMSSVRKEDRVIEVLRVE